MERPNKHVKVVMVAYLFGILSFLFIELLRIAEFCRNVAYPNTDNDFLVGCWDHVPLNLLCWNLFIRVAAYIEILFATISIGIVGASPCMPFASASWTPSIRIACSLLIKGPRHCIPACPTEFTLAVSQAQIVTR